MPFFSIVIPLFNKENYIKDTLNSAINQSFNDFEVIIINDGSTDFSLSRAKEIRDKRIRVITQENKGLCASRNLGIELAKGKYIALLDADDLWTEDYLETIHNLISNYQNYKVFATNVKLLFPNTNASLTKKTFLTRQQKIITNYFKLGRNIMGPSSLVINKTVFKKVGYFDEKINYGEEDDFYIRCFNTFDLVYYDEIKSYYRTCIKNQLTAPNKNFNRKIPNYETYLKKYNHPDLKKFLDFVYFRIVVLYKMERNEEKVLFYKKKIFSKNLTLAQKIKFHLPTPLFYHIKLAYLWFSKMFTHC
ncbi:glycosyltransferase family 2 protein [Aestuariibaculum sp. M13]|uniref:glycosyltransferase family 2 protein n=1 Tax=Aestuariibaculum sp. M13 TaxID=2967132 RepID=UPI002159FE7F|nr:glycosyltransferase family A protein [Aestuariibaculum sp. M13]MCR8666459.1 glycosyltransferase family 2 protein [Aestuariibaculum sp. M13]